MSKFTDAELASMSIGRSPEQLADLNLSDGEWERHGAELRAAHAESTHQLDLLKSAGLHDLAQLRHDPEIVEAARVLHNQAPSGPSVNDLIEAVVIPIREKYLETFKPNAAPVAARKAGPNLSAFNKLVGGSNG